MELLSATHRVNRLMQWTIANTKSENQKRTTYINVFFSEIGSSNLCCYNDNGDLMYAGDTDSGSRVEYSAPWGLHRTARKVPSISHWRDDLVPYLYCCEWQRGQPTQSGHGSGQQQQTSTYSRDCFDSYATSRPTVDCKNYRTPGIGKHSPVAPIKLDK